MSSPGQSVEEIQIDLRPFWLTKVIFHTVAAFYFLGPTDWEIFMETIVNTVMHHSLELTKEAISQKENRPRTMAQQGKQMTVRRRRKVPGKCRDS